MSKVARHITNFYGRAALSLLLEDLRNQVSLSQIADRMGVSRQRVHQWKKALGYETIAWEPHPEVVEVMNGDKRTEETNKDSGG